MGINNSKKLNISLPFSMETALPLDYNSVFSSFSEATAAAESAVAIGGIGSKYYIGQNVTVVDPTSGIYKTYRITPENTLQEIAAQWSFKNGVEETIDVGGTSYIGLSDLIYGRINIVYATVSTASADWNTVFTTVRNTSGAWEQTTNNFQALSAKTESLYNTTSQTSGKWNSSYQTLNSLSAKWNATKTIVDGNYKNWNRGYNTLNTLSAGWENARTTIESTSANNESVYSTVYSTSAVWSGASTLANEINAKIPFEATSTNKLADKQYVDDKTLESIGTYRGSFANWAAVPTTSAGYNTDSYGRKTPQQNDFIIVIDDSINETTVTVASNPVGRKTSRNILDFSGETILIPINTVLTSSHITLLEENYIEVIYVYKTGSWRYRYVGVWSEGTAGKNNWKSEYQINDTSFSEKQLAAINSGITDTKVYNIAENRYNISKLGALSSDWSAATTETKNMSSDVRSTVSTMKETSGTWNTVTNKVDKDYFLYYSASSWSQLTNDDTDYSRVPVGMIFIYEEDATPMPITGLSIYTKETGILKFSSNITYDPDFGILMIGGNATFDQGTSTLTIPGSSDVDAGTIFNSDNCVLSLSDTLSWNGSSGILVLSNKDTYSNGIITLNGNRIGEDTRTQFTVTNHLQHTTNSNTAQFITKGNSYIAVINVDTGYTLTTLSCTMGGVAVTPAGDNSFNIPNVTGDIVITAYAQASVSTNHTVTNSLTHCGTTNSNTTVPHGSTFTTTITADSGYTLTNKSCIMNGYLQPWVGNTLTIDFVENDIYITATAVVDENIKSTFYTSNNMLRLGADSTYSNNMLKLGGSVTFNSQNNTLEFRGTTGDVPYASISNNLTNVTTNNPQTEILEGTAYIAKLSPQDSSFEFSSKTCVVNGTSHRVGYDGTIYIPSVDGNVAIVASASKISRSEFTSSTEILKLPFGTTYTNNTITFPNSVRFNTENSTIEMRGIVSGNTYYKVSNNLINVTNSNGIQDILNGSEYTATLSTSSGYEISNCSCYMGDVQQTIGSDYTISIPSVTAEVEIYARAIQST